MEVDSNVHPPDAEGGASSAASVIPYDNNNYLPPLSSLHYVVLQLPLEHITSYLSNTSVAFFALAVDPSYSSRNGSSGVAGTSEAVNFLMEQEGRRGRWADICLDCVDWINDNDVYHLLSLVVNFNDMALKRLTIRDCPGVIGTGLGPLINQDGLKYLIFHDNGFLPRRSRRLAEGGWWTPLEEVKSIINLIAQPDHYLNYLRLPLEWTGAEYGKGWGKEKGLKVIHCSSNCCKEGPIQALYWCHYCGRGSFCERSSGTLFVFCQKRMIACCMSCMKNGVRGLLLPNTFAQKCGHNMPNNWGCQDQCSNWFCVCGCESGSTCFECSGEICRSCNFGEDEFCVDIEWQRCQYCNVAFCHGRCNE